MRVLPGFAALPAEAETVTPHPRPYFLFVGRLEEYKGVQDAISSFPLGSSYDLLIAGAGRYEPELRRLAESRPNVHLIGRKGPDELSPYYKHARALIAPSLTLETFGMVVAKAMSHGTPVIARDLGPYPELLAGGGGLLFCDRNQLAEAIRRLGDNDELRATLGTQALASYRPQANSGDLCRSLSGYGRRDKQHQVEAPLTKGRRIDHVCWSLFPWSLSRRPFPHSPPLPGDRG